MALLTLVLLVVLIAVIVLVKFIIATRLELSRVSAIGTVIASKPTGVEIKGMQEMMITITIVDSCGESWTTTIREAIPQHRKYITRPGAIMCVLYDLRNKLNVMIDNT